MREHVPCLEHAGLESRLAGGVGHLQLAHLEVVRLSLGRRARVLARGCRNFREAREVVLVVVVNETGRLRTYQRREGVFSRASVLDNAKTMEPAAWWSTYGRHLPLLSAYAPRILAQPPAASQAERNWSVYGQIRSQHRSRMQHATADKLVYAHEALHLEQKMQDEGWKPDVERWESDTDSEGSDEEVDFHEGSNLSQTQVLALCM